jgi:hypothetical protein
MASNQVGREASRAVVNEHDLCHFRPERVLDVSSSSSAFLVSVLLSLNLYSRLLPTFTTAFRSVSHHATCTSLTDYKQQPRSFVFQLQSWRQARNPASVANSH